MRLRSLHWRSPLRHGKEEEENAEKEEEEESSYLGIAEVKLP